LVKKFLDDNSLDLEFPSWRTHVLPGGLIYEAYTDRVMDLPEKFITG